MVLSSLDELLEFSNNVEFLSSSGGGIGVLLIECGAEGSGVIEEFLVSVLLVAGGLGDGSLLGDTGSQLLDLGCEGLLEGFESGDVGIEDILLVVVELDGGVVVIDPVGVEGLKGILQGVQEGHESLDIGLVSLLGE